MYVWLNEIVWNFFNFNEGFITFISYPLNNFNLKRQKIKH